MLSRENKAQKIDRFSERVAQSEAIIIAENAGLSVQDMESLRGELKRDSAYAQVMKNTLAKRVLAGSRFDGLCAHLSGPLVYGGGKDPAQVAKIFTGLAKRNPKFIIRGGALADQEVLDAAAVQSLAQLPSREQLLAKLAGTMQAPLSRFVTVLHAVPSGFVRALAAVRNQKSDTDDSR